MYKHVKYDIVWLKFNILFSQTEKKKNVKMKIKYYDMQYLQDDCQVKQVVFMVHYFQLIKAFLILVLEYFLQHTVSVSMP